MANIDDILATAKLPERSVPLCLRGDLQATFEELERRLEGVRERDETTGAGGKLANPSGSDEARELAQQIQDLREEMRQATVAFRFRALTRREWSNLLAKHKTGDGDGDEGPDLIKNYDWETLGPVMVAACCIDPAMSTEQAGELADKVTDRQWDLLCGAAVTVNKVDVDIPFSVAASATLLNTGPR